MQNEDILQELQERCRQDHRSWINGDGSGYALPDDGTILGGIGGYSFGGQQTSSRQRAVASHWERGTGEVEFLNGGVSEQIAWLTFIERATVTFRGDPTERRWDLRVTEIFRRSDDDWERVHRHADPLVDRRPMEDVTGVRSAPS
jgi:hypothetical protein